MSDGRDIAVKPTAAEPLSGLQSEASIGLSSRVCVVGDRAELLDTQQTQPVGLLVGPSNPDADIRVTVMVKSRASDQEMNQTLKQIMEGQQKPLTDAEFNARFGANPNSMSRVEKFAAENGLKVEKADANSGQISLQGTVKDFNNAFGVKLDDYKEGPVVSRERSGVISVPKDLANDVLGVFGLDNRKQADSHLRCGPLLSRDVSSSFMPNQVADAYNFPKESMGAGQAVGIVELGGGLNTQDNAQYYQDHGLKVPSLQIVGVDGATNSPGGNSPVADGEVALDSQVMGAVAPDAKQQLIFAPNSEQGFLDAITRATFPENGEAKNTAISISWGQAELANPGWSSQAIQNMDTAFKKAALKGISVFAAAGDNGAQDNTSKYSADFPSSDPYVTGCGGTNLEHGGHEVVWNDARGPATGGGLSRKFGVPDFQRGITLPKDANPGGQPGRGDPDIAGDAAPSTGYLVRVDGKDEVIGGTSAVAPLYAGLMMRVNGALGHPAGYLNLFLYKHGNTDMFKDITEGNNNGYNAGPGWDACTGWGCINGQKFLDSLRAQGK